jgi:hypothetical protein
VAATVCTPPRPDDCGVPVHWPEQPLVYALARSDDPMRAAVERAFARWRDADCGGGRHPKLAVAQVAAPPEAGGRGGVIELSDEWPARGGGTLAITQLFFAPDSGRIARARVVFYASQLRPHGAGPFLESIAVHEIGHFLGIGHSADPYAVMSAEVHDGSVTRPELARDDIAGICAIYPPDDDRAVAPASPWPGRIAPPAALAALIASGVLVWRRRRRSATAGPPGRRPGPPG